MKICLYLDEDSSRGKLIQALKKANLDVLTTSEANNLRSPDPEQLIYATQQERVIYTYNIGDFCRLHGLLKVAENYSAETIKNQLVFIGGYIREDLS